MSEDKPSTNTDVRKLNVKIDDETAQGVYANLAMVIHGESEFLVDFMFLQPGRNEAKVGSRIILSPRQAKRLLAALRDNVNKYEKRYGIIPMPTNLTGDGTVH